MSITVTPSQYAVYEALRSFLLAILPDGTEVIIGQNNRTPEPACPNFVVMNALRRERIETNIDTYQDCTFIGSIVGNILTPGAFSPGSLPLVAGQPVWGTGVAPNTIITGTVGGIYTVNISQNCNGSMAAGGNTYQLNSIMTFQIDVHSADQMTSTDMAAAIQTMIRDDYAVQFFNSIGPYIWPIHGDDPRQAPFINAEQQYETRWIVEIQLQVNQVSTGVGQQFFTHVEVDLIEVL